MRYSKRYKFIAITLLIVLTMPIMASAVPSPPQGASSLLGTNLALGSPLLDPNFQPNEWNKWELIAFGVFLSNFTQPLVDDYESAFGASNRGSQGSGLKALQFGSGNDPVTNQVLKEMLSYVIANQTSAMKRLYVRRLNDNNQAEMVEATFGDLFLYSQLKSGYLEAIERIAMPDTAYVEIKDYWTVRGPRRFISNDIVLPLDGGSYETIFSFSDGWDVQMMAAWLLRVGKSPYAARAFENFKKFIQEEAPLYLDSYGNIVVLSGDTAYVVFPAAANQHITQTPQYNMLQSVLFNGSYLNASGRSIVQKGISESLSKSYNPNVSSNMRQQGAFGALSGTQEFEAGRLAVMFDSHALVVQKLKEMGKIQEKKIDDLRSFGRAIVTGVLGPPEVPFDAIELPKIIDELFQAEISTGGASAPFRIEIIKADEIKGLPEELKYLARYINDISAILPIKNGVPTLTYINTNHGREPLFSNPVVTSVSTYDPILKEYMNYLYNTIYKGNLQIASTNSIDVNIYRMKILEAKSLAGLTKWAITAKDSYKTGSNDSVYEWPSKEPVSIFFKDFINSRPNKKVGLSLQKDYTFNEVVRETGIETVAPEELKEVFKRIVKVYPASTTLEIASNVLGVREGTDFALWSPYIYATYLNWYGITKDGGHKFNTKIFNSHSDILKFDMEKIAKGMYLTAEEKKNEILDYTYMMLHPTAGREYRAKMLTDGITDWIYRTYQNIVYGGVTQYYNSSYGNIATRSANGFLHINSYSDNFMTSWFIKRYVEYVVIFLGISTVLMIIVGVITQKRLIWFIVSMFLVVNVLILMPAIGEITPYVVSNAINNMFEDKMSYWAMSEAIYNNDIENTASERAREARDAARAQVAANWLTKEDYYNDGIDSKRIANVVRMLSINYLDRTLMLRLDISKKVNETQLENFDEIQRIHSARWLLPMIMRQFTASDKSANYVFVPLGDEYVNVSNLYAYYVPSDLANPRLRTTQGTAEIDLTTGETTKLYDEHQKRNNLFADYIPTSYDHNVVNGHYNTLVVSSQTENYHQSPGWESLSRLKDDTSVVHTSSYFLSGIKIPSRVTFNERGEARETDWVEYVRKHKDSLRQDFLKKASELEVIAGAYDSFDIATVSQDYGYLWATQNPLHYFYQVIRDTFRPDANVAVIAGELQGTYEMSSVTGKEERRSFMHYRDTGKIRDFLDMQELFTNVIPYLYQVQILAGGFDGKSGALGDAKIENYSIYKNNYKSWLFRSNWVTKLMESPLLTRSTTVRDAKGNRYIVENPLLPSCYPKERPMVFSEAQMYMMGLNESDLSIPELKIIKIGRAVERRWTLLLNYVNLPGVTPDILYKQMALDALLEFNKEFSSGNLLNPAWNMYPTSLDLRALSFDSIMKMLMLNNTKDVRFLYGDTMKNVIENSDIMSALLLIFSAFLCAYIIPFIRDVALGLLFYLGMWAIITNILSGGKTKLKITAAFAINNLVYLVMTLAYYKVFASLINITYNDNVLNVKEVTINVGCPVWIFVIIIIASLLYIWGTWRLIRTAILNYRDLGFEVYAVWTGVLASRIQNAINNVSSSFRRAFSGEVEGDFGGASEGETVIISGSGDREIKVNVNIDEKDRSNSGVDVRSEVLYRDSAYTVGGMGDDEIEINIDIDKEIEKGKRM